MNSAAIKAQIRDSVRNQRMLLDDRQILDGEMILEENFRNIEDPDLRKIISSAETIALYKAVNGELSCEGVDRFFRENGRTICYPRVKGDEMEFFEVSDPDKDFTTGAYGVPEPKSDCRKIYPKDIDVMLVPALAYTDDGYRLGQGGGYYDRWLNAASAAGNVPFTVGVCYEFQMYSALPVEKHDYAVDALMCVCLNGDEE